MYSSPKTGDPLAAAPEYKEARVALNSAGAQMAIRASRTPEGRLYIQLCDADGATPHRAEVSVLDVIEEIGALDLAHTLNCYQVSLLDHLEAELGILPTEEMSAGSVDYSSGLPYWKDRNHFYSPYQVRGNGVDHGLYEQLWREEIQIQRPWVDLNDALIAGDWYVDPVNDSEEELAKAAWVEDALFNVQGGWDQFVTECLYSLITGFSLFEEVYDPETLRIDKFAFRLSKQIREWIFDPTQNYLIAVKIQGAGSGSEVTIPAHHLLLLSHNPFGLDPEGNSALRPIAKDVQAKSMIARLEQLTGEKYGTPILVVSSGPGAVVSEDSDLLNEILDKMTAEDLVVIELVDGRTIELLSPQGVMPDFSEVKAYYDQQISLALKGEGSLLGLNGSGSYALAQVGDDKVLRSIPSYARRICTVINGSRNKPYTGTIRKMIDARFGTPISGRYPRLRFALDRSSRSETWVQDCAAAKQANLIVWGEADEQDMRDHLGLKR